MILIGAAVLTSASRCKRAIGERRFRTWDVIWLIPDMTRAYLFDRNGMALR